MGRQFEIIDIYYGSHAGDLRNMLFMYGATSIYFYVEPNFHSYKYGIYKCDDEESDINHAVAAVGFGPQYFKLRNSWGESWGDGGYFHLQDNTCNMFKWAYGVRAV